MSWRSLNLMRLLSILLMIYCHVPRISMPLFEMVGGSWSTLALLDAFVGLVLVMVHRTLGVKSNMQLNTPDPTCHQFINLPCNLSDSTKKILQRAGIYTPPSYNGARDEQYSIPYFQPTRHMAPCITNALCSMSPIISTHILVLRSMTNAQIILQASGHQKLFYAPYCIV